MRQSEIEQLTEQELDTKLESVQKELFNLKFSTGLKPLENPGKFRGLKKDVARLKTQIRKIAGEKNV